MWLLFGYYLLHLMALQATTMVVVVVKVHFLAFYCAAIARKCTWKEVQIVRKLILLQVDKKSFAQQK